jgi:hypothetical protein
MPQFIVVVDAIDRRGGGYLSSRYATVGMGCTASNVGNVTFSDDVSSNARLSASRSDDAPAPLVDVDVAVVSDDGGGSDRRWDWTSAINLNSVRNCDRLIIVPMPAGSTTSQHALSKRRSRFPVAVRRKGATSLPDRRISSTSSGSPRSSTYPDVVVVGAIAVAAVVGGEGGGGIEKYATRRWME